MDKVRIKDLKFHTKEQDYFGNLAAVLSLMLQNRKTANKMEDEILESIVMDLLYLQKHYFIKRKRERIIRANEFLNT